MLPSVTYSTRESYVITEEMGLQGHDGVAIVRLTLDPANQRWRLDRGSSEVAAQQEVRVVALPLHPWRL
jgi:hypothetical protein